MRMRTRWCNTQQLSLLLRWCNTPQVREVGGVKLLQLKNPWAKTRWRGAYSVHDTARWTPQLREALQVLPPLP